MYPFILCRVNHAIYYSFSPCYSHTLHAFILWYLYTLYPVLFTNSVYFHLMSCYSHTHTLTTERPLSSLLPFEAFVDFHCRLPESVFGHPSWLGVRCLGQERQVTTSVTATHRNNFVEVKRKKRNILVISIAEEKLK